MGKPKLPTDREIAWAILEILKNHGRPMAVSELLSEVVRVLSLDPRILDIRHKTGSYSELEYRMRWVLTKLKNLGLVEIPERGYRALTRSGVRFRDGGEVRDNLISQFGPEIFFGSEWGKNDPKYPNRDKGRKPGLLVRLQNLDPHQFENVCDLILSKFGIRETRVTARVSDGSFEGMGLIQIDTISFRVFFRCRKSTKAISKDEVMNFRGTMIGRAENGLYIITSTFSDSALKEAVRVGAPPIGLIDGAELCNQVQKLHLEI